MYFDSVEQILSQLEKQPGWSKFREYRQLLQCWEQVVNQQTAQHTRPLYITRQILYVATSSAARAQELSFQRYTLLKKLNHQLTQNLQDIRFSSSQWHQPTYGHEIRPHPFTISDRQKSPTVPRFSKSLKAENKSNQKQSEALKLSSADRAKNAAKKLLKSLDASYLSTPICPHCNSPTSEIELTRWNSCHHCVAQQWSQEYRPPTFPERK